jgi:cytosine/adenosine deaminase-related metal-dependent hydrolase
VPLCLGSDEMNTDDSVNLWFVAKTAALLHTLSTPDDALWPQPDEVLHALTRGGARAIRRAHDLGQLAVGAAADVILLDLDTVSFTPLNHLPRQLVHCEDGHSVRTTVVAGRVVYEDGRITTVDERALRSELRAAMRGVQAQLGRAAAEATRLEPAYRAMLARALQEPVDLRRTLY